MKVSLVLSLKIDIEDFDWNWQGEHAHDWPESRLDEDLVQYVMNGKSFKVKKWKEASVEGKFRYWKALQKNFELLEGSESSSLENKSYSDFGNSSPGFSYEVPQESNISSLLNY